MTVRYVALTTIIVTVVALGTAHAQSPADRTSPSPTVEPAATTSLHLFAGVWNLEGDNNTFGAEISHKRGAGISTVYGIDAGYSRRPDRYMLMTAAISFTGPPDVRGDIPFVTIGVASATGLSFDLTPTASVGLLRGADPFVKARFELQWFARGHGIRDRSRMLIGLVITP
jgi:hypothetical protein